MLCHGGPGMWDYLAPVADLVDDRATVYRYDQRGSRHSDDAGPLTIARFTADLDELRAHFGHDQWIVGGHSWGAALALHYALAYPDRVRALVYLSGTGIGSDWNAAYHAEATRRRTADEEARLAELKTLDRSPAEEHERRVLAWHPDYADRDRARAFAAALDQAYAVNYEANASLSAELKTLAESETAARCAGLDVPALIVHGAADPRPVWGVDSLAAALPRAEVRVIEAAGHLPWVEAPTEFAQVLGAFLASLR